MKSCGSNFLYKNCSNSFLGIRSYFRQSKLSIIISVILLAIALFTGVFTAIKNCDQVFIIGFGDDYICSYVNGSLASWEIFFSRLWSNLLCLLLIFVLTISYFTSWIGMILCLYRAYLVGLNVALIICRFGFSGVLTALLIVLPCHLLCLIAILFFYNIKLCKAKEKKRYGTCYDKKSTGTIVFLAFALLIVVINLIETLLLSIFCTQIILII